MKKILLSIIVLILPSLAMSATRNVVPRATSEGSIGTPAKHWSSIYVDSGSVREKLYVGSMTVYGTITTTNSVTASVYYGDGSQLTGITAGGGGGGGQIKVVIDSGTVFTTVSTINVTQRDFASAFTAATWTVRLSSNVARLDRDQIFFGSTTVMNNFTVSTGNLTLVPPYPVLGIGTGFYGNPSSIRTMLEARANYTQGFVEIALRNPSTTDGTGIAYRLSNDDINSGISRYGLTASLNSVLPSVAFIQHPSNGLHISKTVPTQGNHPLFVGQYINQSDVSMVGIGTTVPQALLQVVSTPGMTIPLVIFSTPSLVPSAGRMLEVNRSSVVFGVPIYVSSGTSFGTFTASQFRGDGSALTGISASAIQSLPLIAGDTGYAAIYSTKTWSATQTFKSTMTFNAVAVFNSSITVMSSSTIAGVIFSNSTAEEPPYVSRATGSIIATNVNIMAASDQNNLCPLNIWDKTGQLALNLGTDGDLHVNDFGGGTLGTKFASIYDGVIPESGQVNGIVMQNYSQKSGNFSSIISQNGLDQQTAGIYLVNVTSAGAFGNAYGSGSRLGRILFYTGTAEDDFVYERGRFDEHGNFVVGVGTGSSKMDVKAGSITVRGAGAGIYSSGDICSSGTFRGDGSKLTGITASASQSLPLIAGDTGYFAIYSTRTISATQTFQSSVTFSSTSLSIGGNLYHFPSTAPASSSALLYDAGGKVFWGARGGSGGSPSNPTFNYTFNAAQANIMGSSQPYISNSTSAASAGVFFDDTSTQAVTWSTILNPYTGGTLNADIIYTSSITAGTINWGVFVECKTPSTVGFDYDSDSFDVINSTAVTVGGTANMAMKATKVLTNGDSCQSGDILRIKLQRTAGDTDSALGKARMRFLRIYE